MSWMSWTLPTAIFFIAIAFMLAGMTVWQLVLPTKERKGFLPIATTRGDRLFIGLLTSAFIHLAFLGATDMDILVASGVSILWMLILMRWG